MKKSLSLALSLIMIITTLCALPFTAHAGMPKIGDNLTVDYDMATCTLTISGTGPMYDYDVYSGPDNKSPYDDDAGIFHLVVEEGVTSIGDYAFNNCTGLLDVSLPSTLVRIGKGAFNECYWMTDCYIPGSVQEIDEWAFCGCNVLSSVNLPFGLTQISARAFSNCYALTQVFIPYSVTKIGNYAFNGCTGLTEIDIPNGVTTIEYNAFAYCENLKKIELPKSIETIDEDAFLNTPLETIVAGCDNQFVADYVAKNPDVEWEVTHYEKEGKEIAPTCTKEGLSAPIVCAKCGITLVPSTTLTPTGHNYKGKVIKSTKKNVTVRFTCTMCKKSYTKTYKQNPITAKGKSVTVKYSKLKKKTQTVARKSAISVSKAKGTVTYAKVKGNKKITVNKKTGKITVKKGLKKGTYKVKVQVKAAGNKTYYKKTKTVTVTIKVK